MSNEEDFENFQQEDNMSDKQKLQIQRLFSEIEARAKKSIDYMVAEGFLDRTEDPGVFKYTPEGLFLAQQQYKQMKKDGLL